MTGARDASDLLSPILVKELRQGVRSHVFTGAFLLQQLLLLLVSALALATDGRGQETLFFFWMCVAVPVLVVLPLSAGTSVSGERTAGTLEPMLLTRLSARRIAAGKWAATASQVGLLALAALPYVFMRYFLGGVNLVQELGLLLAFLLCSLLLTAVAVGLSPASLSPLFRWGLSAFLGLVLSINYFTVFTQMSFAGSLDPAPFVAFGALVLLSLLAALEAASLQIAPPALARPGRLRCLALAVAAVAVWVSTLPVGAAQGVSLAWSGVLVAGVCVASLCSSLPPLPSLYAPFFRSPLRRAAALVFAPGWPAGVGFTVVAVVAASLTLVSRLGLKSSAIIGLGVLGSLLLPVALSGFVAGSLPGRVQPLAMYLLVQLASFGLSTLAPIGEAFEAGGLETFGRIVSGLCPAAYAVDLLERKAVPGALDLASHAVFLGVVGLVLGTTLIRVVRAWKTVTALVRAPAVP